MRDRGGDVGGVAREGDDAAARGRTCSRRPRTGGACRRRRARRRAARVPAPPSDRHVDQSPYPGRDDHRSGTALPTDPGADQRPRPRAARDRRTRRSTTAGRRSRSSASRCSTACGTCSRRAGPVVVYPSSGTGAWEAALVNTLSPGDRVLAFETGHFATLWRAMAERLGLTVKWVEGDWRHGVDPERGRGDPAARARHRRRDGRPQRDLDRRDEPRSPRSARRSTPPATTRCCSSTRSPRSARSTTGTRSGASTSPSAARRRA